MVATRILLRLPLFTPEPENLSKIGVIVEGSLDFGDPPRFLRREIDFA